MADQVTRCRPLLGTFVEVTAPCGHDAAFAAIERVERVMSFHRAGSDLAAIRRAAPGDVLALDAETVNVLRIARALFEATGGLFDVAVGHRLIASGFLPDADCQPLEAYDGSTADIAIIDDTHVRIDRRVAIDLGGIAKGHAVDLAIAALRATGADCGMVNAGGDLRGFGACDWRVGLRDADGLVRHEVMLRDAAMASSANSGKTSPHIGRYGTPVLLDGRVTVVADTCMIADALTKVAMIDRVLADAVLADWNGRVLDVAMLEAA